MSSTLVSQNRNAVLGFSVDGTPVAPGDSVAVKPGDTIELVIDAKTATQGYEQLEMFMILPPDPIYYQLSRFDLLG